MSFRLEVYPTPGTDLSEACSDLYDKANKTTNEYFVNFNGIIISMKMSDTRAKREREERAK